jgi:hypothetical protein
MAHPGQPSWYVLAGIGTGAGDDASPISASQQLRTDVAEAETYKEGRELDTMWRELDLKKRKGGEEDEAASAWRRLTLSPSSVGTCAPLRLGLSHTDDPDVLMAGVVLTGEAGCRARAGRATRGSEYSGVHVFSVAEGVN